MNPRPASGAQARPGRGARVPWRRVALRWLSGAVMALSLGTAVQADAAADARAAADRLEEASRGLERAEGARDRVDALTETVRAYEAGLQAMREGLRAASIREQRLSRELASREAEIARLLGVLQSIARSEGPQLFLHPAGPVGTARGGMLLADVTPALSSEAEALRADLEEVTTLRKLQEDAESRLREGLTGVQEARTRLSQAISDRTDLPKRFTEDPMRTAVLIASTETLDGFASGLAGLSGDTETAPETSDISDRKGRLDLPVQGTILRAAGEADAAGIERPGVLIATRPRALVTAPAAATVRYSGPLLDYGLVTILEPQPEMMLVLAGLDVVYVEAGDVLQEGAPVGLMGGEDAQAGAVLSQSGEGAGSERSESLYMEVRQDAATVDPLTWFAADKD